MRGFDGSKRLDLQGVGGPLDHGGVGPLTRKDVDGLVCPELAFFRKAKTGFTRPRTHSFASPPSHRARGDRHNARDL